MIRPHLSLTLAALLCMPLGAGVSAGGANYQQILETYRHGNFDAAVRALSALPLDERYRGARVVVGEALRPFRKDVLQAVLALHTEVGLGQGVTLCGGKTNQWRVPPATEQKSLLSKFPYFEQELLQELKAHAPADEFILTWYLTVMSYYDRAFPGGYECFADTPARIRAHPEMQLAIGAIHEKAWQQFEADGWTLSGFTPDLGSAAKAFRRALNGLPDLHEARLRLAHVLVLQGRPEEALQVVDGLRNRQAGEFAYLALLVEGQAHEQRGNMDHAATVYREAHRMNPQAQSAIIALAQLAYMQGHRAEALENVQQLPSTSTAGVPLQPWVWHRDGADPWSWYYFGTAWRFPMYLSRLHAIVARNSK